MPPPRDHRARRRDALAAVIGLGTVALLLLLPAVAGARAGGGGGFHSSSGGGGSHSSGGGNHSSGSGSSNGSGSAWIGEFIVFCFRHPLFGLVVVTIVVVGFWYLKRNGWLQTSVTTAVGDGLAVRPSPPPRAGGDPVGLLRQHDPAFDPDAFCQRVGTGFMKVQDAWCRQNLAAVRPFISDAVHERFSIQFAEQKTAGYHDQMSDVAIGGIVVADASSDAVYDAVSVHVRARARDQRVLVADGRVISGSNAVEPFAEVWSFLRRRGATTTPGKAGLLEGNCPNCGAGVELNESANCASCGALLRSGEYDWVLAEITQASEWRPGEQAAVPGLDALRARDPDLNVQAIEDRASVVFWRRAAADRVGKVEPLRKAATDEYLQTVATQLRPNGEGIRSYTGECAVGSVQTRGFLPAAEPGGFDRAVVDVYWTGTRFTVNGDGRPPRPHGEHTLHTLLVLGRRADAKTDAAKGISSAHCPTCGAPEDGGVGGSCAFCGAVLNDGSHGWVLTDVQSPGSADGQHLLEELGAG